MSTDPWTGHSRINAARGLVAAGAVTMGYLLLLVLVLF